MTSSNNANQVVSVGNASTTGPFGPCFAETPKRGVGARLRHRGESGVGKVKLVKTGRCAFAAVIATPTSAHGFTVTNGDNSFVTTMSHDGGNRDYNFGLGAGEGGNNTCDWDNDTSDGSNSGGTTAAAVTMPASPEETVR